MYGLADFEDYDFVNSLLDRNEPPRVDAVSLAGIETVGDLLKILSAR